MNKKKSLPQRQIIITFKQNDYTVEFPDTGQLIDIENYKAELSNGYYRQLMNASSDALYAKLLIDMIATYTILIPKMIRDLNIDVMRLSLIDSKPLLDTYLKDYMPWYDKWVLILNDLDDDLNKDNEVEETKDEK